MFTSLIAATVSKFNGKADKNGKDPVILVVLAGKCPNRNVISGTVAENIEIETGKSYLFQVREAEESDDYGRQFVFTKAETLDAKGILESSKILGKAEVFDVTSDADISETEEHESPEETLNESAE